MLCVILAQFVVVEWVVAALVVVEVVWMMMDHVLRSRQHGGKGMRTSVAEMRRKSTLRTGRVVEHNPPLPALDLGMR